jgi:hypothetical protein
MLSSHTFAASDVRQLTVTKIAQAGFGLRFEDTWAAAFSTRLSFDAVTPANECCVPS